MRRIDRTRLLHWIAPVAVAGLLVGGTITVNAISASAGSGGLPARTAAQLLVDVEQAKLTGLSGTVVQSSDLGIPSLPGIGSTDSSSMTSLITGTHTLRVWYDGTDKSRIALLGSLGETDVIKNGANLWTWSSKDNTATHRKLPDATGKSAIESDRNERSKGSAEPRTALDPTDLPKTPQDAADAVLAAIDPSTSVSVDANQSVAGRPVYQLTLRPRSTTGSLIDRVGIAIDGVTHIPLRVQIFGTGQSGPAFEVSFSSVDFTAPDPAQFNFNPPPGAQVTQSKPDTGASKAESGTSPASSDASGTQLVGTSWSSVLIASSSVLPSAGQLGRVLQSLPKVSGPWGSGHLLAGTVFSMVITDGGKVAIGPVVPALLYSALAAK